MDVVGIVCCAYFGLYARYGYGGTLAAADSKVAHRACFLCFFICHVRVYAECVCARSLVIVAYVCGNCCWYCFYLCIKWSCFCADANLFFVAVGVVYGFSVECA